VDWYVPKGTWTSLITGRVYTGPGWFTEQCSYLELPLLVRPGAVLILGDSNVNRPDYDYSQSPEIHVFQPESLGELSLVEATTVTTKGAKAGSVQLIRKSSQLEITWNKLKSPSFVIHQDGNRRLVAAQPGESDTFRLDTPFE
jgi:alpha-D-xyloside xylohydrolase